MAAGNHFQDKADGDAAKEKKNDRRFWNVRPYLAAGLVVFVVAVLIIAVFFLFYRYDGFAEGWSKLMFIFQPILIGLAIAYLINPIVRRMDKLLQKKYLDRSQNQERTLKRIRGVSVFVAMAVFLGLIAALIMLVVPQVINSVRGLMETLPEQFENLYKWADNVMRGAGKNVQMLQNVVTKVEEWLQNWVQDTLLPQSEEILASVTSGVIIAVRTVVNFFIGIAIAIYVLTTKEHLKAQTKKFIYTILKPRRANWLLKVIRKSDTIFGGFIIGKIIDSIIIGIICFVALTIMRMPYTVLVSVIVGVTNVIPFFGPFIGAIPSVLLILLVSPWQALYFIIFILILQQVDGNIIGPKILGDKTGLSMFWVLCAILVFGGIFGIPGMILGVPVFGIIYYIVQEIMAIVLKKRKLPVEREHYYNLKFVDEKNGEMNYYKDEMNFTESDKENENEKEEAD